MNMKFILICSLFLILSISSACASGEFKDMDIEGSPLINSNITLDSYEDSVLASQNENYIVANESISISASNVTKYYMGPERFNVGILDNDNNPVSNKSMVISINGVDYSRTTDSNGFTSLALNLRPGEYPVYVSCGENIVNSHVNILSTINASDIVKMEKNDTQYYATFLNNKGNYLSDGSIVRFNINGVFYDRKVNSGLAKLNINLHPDDYIITAINLETGDSYSNKITVLSRLIENRDLTKYFRNETQYTLKVLNSTGGVVGAGESVTFNINGVFYTRLTNANGVCKLNINLNPGEYIITAQNNVSIVSNKIKVLSILSANDLTKLYATPDKFVATLLDAKGKLYPNQAVLFNINGVFYNRTTDNNGQAKLNINLWPGEYIITSMFNEASISNRVIVKPTSISIIDISGIANELNEFYEKYKKFPNTIKTSYYSFTIPEFFYLMNKAISQIKSSDFKDIKIIYGIKSADSSVVETINSCLVKENEYVSIANNLISQISKNNKVPSTVDTSMGKVKFNDYMVIATRVMSFYYEYYGGLADYVTFVSQNAFKDIGNPYGLPGKNVFIDADGGSNDKKWDLARALTAAGWNVKVGETDSNSHYKDYFNTPSNYVLINIYNGFCAGTIRELASNYIQNVLRSRNVVCVPVWDTVDWINYDGMGPYRYGNFNGYSAEKAWDDNFSITDPYISNVGQYLSSNHIIHCSYPSTEGLVYQFLHGGYTQTIQ